MLDDAKYWQDKYYRLAKKAWELRTHQNNYFSSHSSLDLDKAKKVGRELDALLIKEKKEQESKQIKLL